MSSPQTTGMEVDHTPGRLHSLDGLRGIAALVVVAYHVMNAYTPFAMEARRMIGSGPRFGTLWWFTASPVSLAVAGGQAVLVFFVLSGIAVTLPVLRRPGFDWWAYYPRRAVRLLLPAAASVVIAMVLGYLTAGMRVPQTNPALQGDLPMTVSWKTFARAFDLASGELSVNSPLWSLNWEVWFSMALPLFAAAAFLLHGRWAVTAAVASMALSWLGYYTNAPTFMYLSPFLLGALVAGNFAEVSRISRRVFRGAGGHVAGIVVVLFALLCIGLSDWFFAYRGIIPWWARDTVPLGAVLLVIAGLFWFPFRWLLETRPVQWLGSISFSLYLVHLPLISASLLVFGSQHWLRACAVAVPAGFVLAILFQRLVERPSHRLSKHVGKLVSAGIGRAEARAGVTGGGAPVHEGGRAEAGERSVRAGEPVSTPGEFAQR